MFLAINQMVDKFKLKFTQPQIKALPHEFFIKKFLINISSMRTEQENMINFEKMALAH